MGCTVRFSTFPRIFLLKLLRFTDSSAQNSGQRLNNVTRTPVLLARTIVASEYYKKDRMRDFKMYGSDLANLQLWELHLTRISVLDICQIGTLLNPSGTLPEPYCTHPVPYCTHLVSYCTHPSMKIVSPLSGQLGIPFLREVQKILPPVREYIKSNSGYPLK